MEGKGNGRPSNGSEASTRQKRPERFRGDHRSDKAVERPDRAVKSRKKGQRNAGEVLSAQKESKRKRKALEKVQAEKEKKLRRKELMISLKQYELKNEERVNMVSSSRIGNNDKPKRKPTSEKKKIARSPIRTLDQPIDILTGK